MAMITAFAYHHLFDGVRPNAEELLKNIPSKFVIGMLSIITDTITIRKNSRDTQIFLLRNFTVNVPTLERKRILSRAVPQFNSGYELFATPYTVEFINRELINFRDEDTPKNANYGDDEVNFLKAYLAIVDEMNERDVKQHSIAIENSKRGSNFFIELLWPHLIKQFEFANRSDVVYESLKGFALMSFLETHTKFGPFIKAYANELGCKNGSEYIGRLLALIATGIKRAESENPMDYMYTVRISEPDPLIESLVIDPKAYKADESKQINYQGLKERPIMKFRDNDYIFPHLDYVYGAFFTELINTFYNGSGIKNLYYKSEENDGFGTFKGDIGKHFSEAILFKRTMTKCFNRQYETLRFFENKSAFNPDCYYRKGNDIFIIEFKDTTLTPETIQSASYETIKTGINDRFASSKTNYKNGKVKSKDKGIFQLKRNIELLGSDEKLFWKIDQNAKNQKLALKNMKIHPVLVHTNVYFDLPGINDYLDKILQDEINPARGIFKSIETFTMINLHYFFDRLLLFSSSFLQLDKELNYYHETIKKYKSKAILTQDPNDWFKALQPFGTLYSPHYRKVLEHQGNNFLEEIRHCWNIKIDV